MKYVSRNRNSNKNIIENSSNSLNFLYKTFLGRLVLKIFISRTFSNLMAFYMNSELSKKKMIKFIRKNHINKYDYSKLKYRSYNDFFIRHIVSSKRPIASNKDLFISPCDSKLTAYTINEDLTLKIKDAYYSIDTLVEEKILKKYINGYALVFRLSVDNFHRYCYIDSGYHGENTYIKGKFHTVQPISLGKYNFYKTNSREYTVLKTNNFKDVIEVEIGAMGIGRIVNLYENHEFKKGEEKGYFEFGGSTIVLLVKKNVIKLDKDIIENSKLGIETNVKYGEQIGVKK